MNAPPRPDSPCIEVCSLDPDTGYCLGCFRTIDEIAGWLEFSDSERAAVRSRLAGRRARFLDRIVARSQRATGR